MNLTMLIYFITDFKIACHKISINIALNMRFLVEKLSFITSSLKLPEIELKYALITNLVFIKK